MLSKENRNNPLRGYNMMFVYDTMSNEWTDSVHSKFVLELKDDILYMRKINGHDPYYDEYIDACIIFFREYERLYGKIELRQRSDYYRFTKIYNQSRTRYVIETVKYNDLNSEFEAVPVLVNRHDILSISCYGKIWSGNNKPYVYDLLDMMVEEGSVRLIDQHYSFEDLEEREYNPVVIRPRIIFEEAGWKRPDRSLLNPMAAADENK